MMKLVKHLLAQKTPVIWAIEPDKPVLDAITIMAEKEIGALLVTKSEQLVGILSERDYARKVILRGKSSRETPVSEIMSSNVVCVNPDDTVETCMQLMTHHNIRHLPVQEQGKLTGMLSVGDLVKAIIADQQETIQQLEGYIMS